MGKLIRFFIMLTIVLSFGCTSNNSGYPDVTAAAVNHPKQPCHQCGQTIIDVTNDHALIIGAAKYIVCSAECRKKQKAWHESQFGK